MEYTDAPRIEPGRGKLSYDKARKTIVSSRQSDAVLLTRALGILHRMATERIGWRAIFRRWYYSDEPLRNDAANLVRDAGFDFNEVLPHTRLVGDPPDSDKS